MRKKPGPTPIGELLPEIVKPKIVGPIGPKPKPPSAIQNRLASMPIQDPEEIKIIYQHSVLCQTCMPYRDPGDEIRLSQRRNGCARFELQAGRVLDLSEDCTRVEGRPNAHSRAVMNTGGGAPEAGVAYLNRRDGWTSIKKRLADEGYCS